MSDEYLWNRSGPVDPEVERLELVLGRLRSTPPEPEWRRVETWTASRPSLFFLAAAAVLVLASAATLRLASSEPPASWSVVRVSGEPTVGDARVAGAARLDVGQWLSTDADSSASLSLIHI